MKRKLLFAAMLIAGALGGQLRAEDAPILAELDNFGGVTVSSLSTFAPAGTTYTLEVTGCVANQAINVTAGSFSYTPTADGTVRFVRVNSNVYVYENSEYKGTATLSSPTITYPEIFLNVTDDATAKTGIYAESNLISNPGFETWSEDFDSNNHKATNWDCNGYAYSNRSRVRSNANLSGQEGSSTFFIHGYGNPAECLSQTISGLQSFTPYKIQFLTWRHEKNANFDVTIGTSAGDGSIYTGTVSVPSSGSKNQSLTFTTGALSAGSYVFAITRKSTDGMGDFDRMTMVAATDGIGITGATGASFLAGTAYAPVGSVSLTNGQDMTNLITNAAVVGGDKNSLSDWTNGRSASGQQYTGAPDNYYMDTWNATLDQKQTIALPAGYYLLKVATRAGTNVTNGNIYAYANGANLNSVQIHKEGNSGNLLGNGWGWTRVPFSVDAVTNVSIGFYAVCGSNKWAGADNFTLTYYDSQANLDAAVIAGAKEDAAAWKTILASTTPATKLLQAAIDNAEATVATVEAAITTARAMEAPYAAYVAQRTLIQALYDVADYEELTTGAHTTLGTALTDAATNVETATTVEGINTVASTLTAAGVTYAGAANPTGDAKFDLTFMLTNPDLTSFAAWTKNVPGWYTDQNIDGQNSQAMHSEGVKGPHGDAFYEYWSESAANNNAFTLYQKVTLPVGTYTINCDALATANGVEGATTSKVYFYANDTQGSLVNSDVLTASEISFVNTVEQEVKIGLKAMEGNQFRWMGIGYVQLFKVAPAAAVVLDESVAYVEAATAADVKLTKTIYEGWNTVVLPFSMTAAEVESVFGAGSLYSFTDADAGTLNFATASALAPHTPYLFKANAAKNISGETISGRTITVSTNSLTAAGTDYNFVGTYTPHAKGAAENPIVVGADYVLGADAAFHKATVKNALKAFRAYIQANESGSDVKTLSICIDGVETAIQAINGENVSTNGAIYNLAGQRVNKAQKGIFIVNGKKVIK